MQTSDRFRLAARRLLAVAALCCLATCALAGPNDDALRNIAPKARVTATVDDDARVTRGGNRHPAAIEANVMGPADDALRLERMILLLKPDAAQATALDAHIAATHDHASPQFGRWLSPREFERHFGVAATDIEQISRWLTGHGFTIDEVPQGGRTIIFSGTVAQLRQAFHTDIRRYRVNSEDHIANAQDPQIPAAFAGVIDGIVSLHDFHSRPLHTRKPVAPDYTSGSSHYMAAADFQTIYNLKPLYQQSINGSGKSIAILGRSNVNPSDMQQFRSIMGLAANPPQIILNGPDPGLVSGDHGESDLDLEWSGAVAPAATIKFVTSKTTTTTDGIDLSASYAVNNNVADIISLSYGQCEASMGATQLSFYNTLWQQATALGITVVVSSGDSGAAGCDSASSTRARGGLGVNGLCSSPYSTCVGGTQFADTANPSLYWSASTNPADQSSALSYIPEVVWNESGANGGSQLWSSGGGVSAKSGTFAGYAKPSWQTAAALAVPAGSFRYVPDVALAAASHDGYLVYTSDAATTGLYAFGGTSASAPSFAGIMALVNQKTGYRQGYANPTLYGLATRQSTNGTPGYFHPITSGNNSVPKYPSGTLTGFSASAPTGPWFLRYNAATGLGSVDANVLVSHWTDLLPATATTLVSNANPSVGGQNVTLTASVSGSAPGGTVQFADGGVNLGAAVALSGGVAALTINSLTTGTHSITAAYSGDAGNQPSASAALLQTVLVNTAVSLSASAGSITVGDTVTFTATVSGLGPSGTVQFKDSGVNLGTAVSVVGSTATVSVSTLSVGNHSISAAYSGDAVNAAAASSAVTETVLAAIPGVSIVSSATTSVAGQLVTITAAVTGFAPTGNVQFTDGGTNLGTPVALSSGTASLSTAALSVGSHSIGANYSGDANNAAASAAPITQQITGNAAVPMLPLWALLLLGGLLLVIGGYARQRHAQLVADCLAGLPAMRRCCGIRPCVCRCCAG